jgi:signal transduction histidine kinase
VTAELPDEERRRLRHDLRAPLTIVAGFAELLASDKPITDENRREYAARIRSAADELRTMLDDLLES